jgi:hypothetical protein
MSAAMMAPDAGPLALPTPVERLRLALLWLMAFSGCFVFIEPGPYEITAALTVFVFAMTGLTLSRPLVPLIIMLAIYDAGFGLSVLQVIEDSKAVTWVFISWYLSITAIFFAAVLTQNTQARLSRITRGYMAAAIVASSIAVLAYFHGFGSHSDFFLKFGRARSTFNDPNVLGAFLVFPGLLLLQRIMAGRLRTMLWSGAALLVIVAALLLSFSRGAWGQFAGAAILQMLLTFIISRSTRERLRISIIAVTGIVLLAVFIALLLSIGRVANIFDVRASLTLDYDVQHLGRFGRYWAGFLLALERPLGIGPLQFGTLFPEDPHNTFLNTFMSGGWIVGVFYPAIIVTTLALGFRTIFIATPWRKTYLAVYCAFAGAAFEGAIVDIDHWRHFFLLLGCVWGLTIAAQNYRRRIYTRGPPPLPALVYLN